MPALSVTNAERIRDKVFDRLVADGPCLNAGCQEWERRSPPNEDGRSIVVERGCDHASCTRYGSKR